MAKNDELFLSFWFSTIYSTTKEKKKDNCLIRFIHQTNELLGNLLELLEGLLHTRVLCLIDKNIEGYSVVISKMPNRGLWLMEAQQLDLQNNRHW